MGRQRQRAQQRRKAPPPAKRGGISVPMVAGGVGIIVALIVLLTVLAVRGSAVSLSPTPTPEPTVNETGSLAPRIDGIPCVAEMLNFHIHSHLSINDGGKPVTVPAYVGILSLSNNSYCLYWLHTHDDTGIIHIEAPHPIKATLGMFFDVWKQPLSRRQVASAHVGRGQSLKIWVNRKPYTGNPRNIVLKNHELIAIDVGPPYPREKGFDFSGL